MQSFPVVAALKDHYEGLGADVILLDAGDFSQGTTLVNHEKGLKAAEYLVTAGYDAISLGIWAGPAKNKRGHLPCNPFLFPV